MGKSGDSKNLEHEFFVKGMTCEACADKVKNALEKVDGVEEAEIDFEDGEAEIEASRKINIEELNKALEPLKKYTLSSEKIETKRGQKSLGMEMNDHGDNGLSKTSFKTYWPLILVVSYIVFGSFYLGWVSGDFYWMEMMTNFMGLFFMAFGFFKLLDLKGFASSYLSYDLPTKAWPTWGYIYPFVELGLGLAYLFRFAPIWTNLLTLIVMSISIVGVIQSVLQKRKIKCACLGTGFNLPMSKVTIIEDGAMILMAGAMLLMGILG